MDAARIVELLEPFLGPVALSPQQVDQVAGHLNLLVRWNQRTNLTAVRDPEDIVTRHIGESLFAARQLCDPASTFTAADFGSGAGFPGLPLKLFAPHVALTLIESQNKKGTFLREVIRALHLAGVEVYPDRAEKIGRIFDLVTMRAVEKFESSVPTAAGLVAPGGRLALLIGSSQAATARNLVDYLRWSEPVPIPLSASRVLLVGTNQSR